jgi:aspartate ammonia-lyase
MPFVAKKVIVGSGRASLRSFKVDEITINPKVMYRVVDNYASSVIVVNTRTGFHATSDAVCQSFFLLSFAAVKLCVLRKLMPAIVMCKGNKTDAFHGSRCQVYKSSMRIVTQIA